MRKNIRIAFEKIWSSDHKLNLLLGRLLLANGVLLVIFFIVYFSNHFLYLGSQSPLDQGLRVLKQHLMINPDDPSTRLKLAAMYFERGEYNRVITQGEDVLTTNPDSQDALYLIGLSYLQTGYPDKAIPLLSKFAELRQESTLWRTDVYLEEVLYYLGGAYLDNDQPSLALQSLDLALEIDHTDADAHFLLGQAYDELGMVGKAAEEYMAALNYVPDFEAVYQALSLMDYDPSQPGRQDFAYAGLAYCQQDYITALQILFKVLDVQPQFTPAHVLLGLVYEELGDLDHARQAMEMALTLDPDNFLAQHILGRMTTVLEGTSGDGQ